MNRKALDNLARIGQLKTEPRNEAELQRLLASAEVHLADAGLRGISPQGRFLGAYNAAHAAALVALRHHGYRSENRFTVFQSLEHTLGWAADRWRVLDAAHRSRNLAEYEGTLNVDDSGIDELHLLAKELIEEARSLVAAS